MWIDFRKRALFYALLFCGISMTAMLIFADRKAITIADVTQDGVAENVFAQNDGIDAQPGEDAPADWGSGPLLFDPEAQAGEFLCIPLHEGVKAENVTTENHYMEKQIWIYIKDTQTDFYNHEAVSGNISGIESGSYESFGNTVILKFSLTDVYECISKLEGNRLYVEFVLPRELYRNIVVVDAGCGGEETGIVANGLVEKEVTLDIIKRLQRLWEDTETKVYYTRAEDKEVSAESRAEFANAVGADMLISIGLNESEDVSVYGTEAFFNAEYFIPGFGNVELADLAERKIVTAISGRGKGLYIARDSDILLQEAKVPSAIIRLGYASNEKEAELLQSDAYRDKIAKGLYDVITEAIMQ